MQDIPVMYCIPKMHKNPISFRFIRASLVCNIKPLSEDITLIFKLLYEKVERYIKGKVWPGIKTFWTTQSSFPAISSINKFNKRKGFINPPTTDHRPSDHFPLTLPLTNHLLTDQPIGLHQLHQHILNMLCNL